MTRLFPLIFCDLIGGSGCCCGVILVAVELLSSDPDRVSISEEPPRPAVLDGKPKNNSDVSDSTCSCFDLTCVLHGKKLGMSM